MGSFFTRRGQLLQWLALLAVTVILPTVSLLWFMHQVVANEKLVVRQKLTALYQDRASDATAKTAAVLEARHADLDQFTVGANPYPIFRRMVLEDHYEGLLAWNQSGTLAYPKSVDVVANDSSSGNPLNDAWQAEFARNAYEEAISLYDRFVTDSEPRVALAAIAGKSRCLQKAGRSAEAIEACKKATLPGLVKNGDLASHLAMQNARLLLLSLLGNSNTANRELVYETTRLLCDDLYVTTEERYALPANHNLFIARKVLEALRGDMQLNAGETDLEKLVAAEELSIAAAESFHSPSSPGGFFRINAGQKSVYAFCHLNPAGKVVVLFSKAGLASVLSGYEKAFAGTGAAYRIVDATGDFVAGNAQPKGQMFSRASLPDGFPGWKVELFFEGSDVFEKAAQRQIAVYTWTGALVILLILIAGGFATRAVRRQIRLNEMKNDFMATVTHELKTPLASMRVLVDTLLEGNVRDEAQAKEYLRLTSRENERLSRMIDNFLTFSRMERNKQAFAIVDANPAAIVHDAVEAVKTKFASQHCQITVEVAENLPEILADHDAMVTVLVNLLDNACKYTTENKQTALKVFADAGSVCFAVSDNGIGLARRHIRRIFDRFYQVDTSLARKVEGCGLGLSIVKFIVDAHKGTIAVESKPELGSTFTVRVPARPDNGEQP